MISGCVKCQYDFRLCGVQESPMGFFFHYYMLTLVSNNVHQISAVNFSSIFNNAFPCLVVFLLTVEVELWRKVHLPTNQSHWVPL